MNKGKSVITLLFVAVILVFVFQNCNDIKLNRANFPSILASPSPRPTPDAPTDSLAALITGPPQQIDAGQSALQAQDLTVNISGSYLQVLPLSANPPLCDLPTDIVVGGTVPQANLTDGNVIPALSYNLDFSNITCNNCDLNSIDRDIRFLRRPVPSIVSFRFKTPKIKSQLGITVMTQNDSLTTAAMGCTNCQPGNYVSLSKEPCDFRALKNPPQFSCSNDYFPIFYNPTMGFSETMYISADPQSTASCNLQNDSIYYLNIKLPGPDLNPGQIDNSDRLNIVFRINIQN